MNNYDLSIIIPSRNEEFLKNTVEDILKNKRGNTEIIINCDGDWPNPHINDHPDVVLLYSPESIGQRAGQNKCAKMSKAKYVMKVDAHCAFDEGFDVKMLEGIKGHDNWTMVPIMRNLHVFDWNCRVCNKKWYMGPDPTKCENPACDSKDFIKRLVWKPRRGTRNSAYRFDKDLRFKYWGEYKSRQEGDIVDTLSLQGSCFMCTRERYWSLDLCDESWGSWGQQGSEVSLKTWLSGGEVKVNKATWYAHFFRTRPGFSFPYPNSGKDQLRARQICQDTFLYNKWPKQIKSLSWLIEKFSPVPGWGEEELAGIKRFDLPSDLGTL